MKLYNNISIFQANNHYQVKSVGSMKWMLKIMKFISVYKISIPVGKSVQFRDNLIE